MIFSSSSPALLKYCRHEFSFSLYFSKFLCSTVLFQHSLILTNDFSKYTTDEYIIKHTDFSPEAMAEFREEMFREFYKSKEYEKRKQEKLKKYFYLKQSYDEFYEFLHEKDVCT